MTTDTPGRAPAPSTGPFDPADVTWTPVSTRLATVRLLLIGLWGGGLVVVTAVVAALVGVAWLWVLPAALALLFAWSAVLVRRQVRALGYAERADDLLIRRGILFRQLVVVPYGRMQYVDVSAGPVQRRFGIATVQLHTAAPGTDATIPGLPPQEAARLRDRLASRGEARLAGL
ncbi:PH domain-containing protein [Cellulomonas sp. JZ18]|uniref:PH domain-containing protein n=1 Tax=Cellulomonas sp. JZ18 TaxID=2654191 RepID=UPI0012D48E39|nr:PH domain-containing protein [Cellulomonas sp. JZ18]QGQ20369.1 PH domain-containing protein [Cellulomonas sp. JZ18]